MHYLYKYTKIFEKWLDILLPNGLYSIIQNQKNGEVKMSISSNIGRPIIASALIVSSLLLFGNSAMAEEVVPVNVENFAKAETSAQFDRILQMTGGHQQVYSSAQTHTTR